MALRVSSFNLDYFQWGGAIFVSKHMRQVMALDSAEVRFFEIDDSQSAPLPRSMNYQLMEPDVVEDVSDPENSDYEMAQFLPGTPPVPDLKRSLALRPDAAPTHDLFFDGFFTKVLLCTDAFASRVLKAGCTGVTFADPNNPRGEWRNRYRTLQGIEEVIGWDENHADITQLVQAID